MFLGLDLGTTNVKAVVTDGDGRVIAGGSSPVDIFHLADGGVEQDIEQIWAAVLSAIKAAVGSGIGPGIQAVGVSSQGGAIQIQNEAGEPFGRVISWMDVRGGSYDAKLTGELGAAWFAAHTGHGMSAVTPGQILRLREEKLLPKNFRLGYVGDVIVSRLCSRAAHDATSLSLAMLYNPSLRKADPGLLEKTGLCEGRLPDLLTADAPAGGLLEEISQQTNLSTGIPVSPAIHDQYAAALGCGAVNAGDVMFGAGTAWVLLAITDKLTGPVVDSAFECGHVVDGLYGQILSMVNGGSSLSWALNTLGLENIDSKQLDEMVQGVPAGCDGLMFLPLMVQGDGKLIGLKLSHTKAHIIRAVIEGLACELSRHLKMFTDAGLGVKQLIMAGCAANSRVTPQIVSNTTSLPVACLEEPDVSAIGAAIIARSLVEPDIDLVELTRQLVPARRNVEPTGERDAYSRLLKRYVAQFKNTQSENT